MLARCRRRQRSMIRRPTASTDSRTDSAGRFYLEIQLGSTSMVHLRPILAIRRSFGLPCFLCRRCCRLLTFARVLLLRDAQHSCMRAPPHIQPRTGFIVPLASIRWKQHRTRPFFGHSYIAPTPHEFLLQKMGLCLTKAFALLVRNS